MAHRHTASGIKRPLRVAESEAIAVDLCTCGTVQLHLGALALHLNLEGLARLAATLGVAVVPAREAAARAGDAPAHESPLRPARGDA